VGKVTTSEMRRTLRRCSLVLLPRSIQVSSTVSRERDVYLTAVRVGKRPGVAGLVERTNYSVSRPVGIGQATSSGAINRVVGVHVTVTVADGVGLMERDNGR
jgi:hypothetical protein